MRWKRSWAPPPRSTRTRRRTWGWSDWRNIYLHPESKETGTSQDWDSTVSLSKQLPTDKAGDVQHRYCDCESVTDERLVVRRPLTVGLVSS